MSGPDPRVQECCERWGVKVVYIEHGGDCAGFYYFTPDLSMDSTPLNKDWELVRMEFIFGVRKIEQFVLTKDIVDTEVYRGGMDSWMEWYWSKWGEGYNV